MNALHLGTAGWSYPDWVGPFYPEGTKRNDMFGRYVQRYSAVELDSSFYGVPSEASIDSWAARAGTQFLICPKFPQAISHEAFLVDCDDTHRVFVERFERLGSRLGPMLLQFPYFRRDSGVDVQTIVQRLDPFLARHRELTTSAARIAVEVRNKAFLKDELYAVLERHGAALATIDHPWMPDPEDMLRRMEERAQRPGGFAYLRLLGDRKGIERITKKWGREVIDQSWRIAVWVHWMLAMRQHGDVFVFANNHYAGHAPQTIAQIEARIAAQ